MENLLISGTHIYRCNFHLLNFHNALPGVVHASAILSGPKPSIDRGLGIRKSIRSVKTYASWKNYTRHPNRTTSMSLRKSNVNERHTRGQEALYMTHGIMTMNNGLISVIDKDIGSAVNLAVISTSIMP